MKKFSLLVLAALALTVSCEKPQSEAEKNAQIEREVQQRLTAEHLTAEQQRLAQQQADLAAREQALADQQANADSATTPAEETTSTPRRTTAATRASDDDAEPASYDTFYHKLEPYGAWRETSDYGYVWQPQQAQRSRDWRPYTDGRWAYTDAGWTWVSEEPFGWATYHYGRWTHLRAVGWVWVPGDEWAPAWVSWRSSNQYVGWAPLPPQAHFDRRRGIQKWADSYYDIDVGEYVFIPNEAIGSLQIRQEVVPVQQNVTIINETTNITNITYNNTTIVNVGPNFEELRARSRRPIERLRLERRSNAEDATPNAVIRGDVLAVSAPVFTAQAAEAPRTVAEPIREVTVDREIQTGSNQPEMARARQKMKSEATPPPDAPAKKYDKPVVGKGSAKPVASPAATATAAASLTVTPTPSGTTTPRPTVTPSARPLVSPTPTAAVKSTATATPTATATATQTATPTATATPTPNAPARATATPVVSSSATASVTPHLRPGASIAAPSGTTRPSAPPTSTATPRVIPPTPAKAISPLPTITPTPPASAASPAEADADVSPAPEDNNGARNGPRAGGRPRRFDPLRNPPEGGIASPLPSVPPSASPAFSGRPRLSPPAAAIPTPMPSASPTPTPLVKPSITPSVSPASAQPPLTAAPAPGRPGPRSKRPDQPDNAAADAAAGPRERSPRVPPGAKRVPPLTADPSATPTPTPVADDAPER